MHVCADIDGGGLFRNQQGGCFCAPTTKKKQKATSRRESISSNSSVHHVLVLLANNGLFEDESFKRCFIYITWIEGEEYYYRNKMCFLVPMHSRSSANNMNEAFPFHNNSSSIYNLQLNLENGNSKRT